MDEKLARMVIAVASRCADDLGDLMPILKEHCSREAYDALGHGVGSAIYEILHGVRTPIFEQFPALQIEYEQNLEKFGRGC